MIIFLTAVNDDVSHIKGLETGADDYISKPVSPKVLVSRINALFRRTGKALAEIAENKILQADGIIVDPVRFVVKANDKEVVLAKKEFELLYLLISKPGRVFLRNEILNTVWGTDVIVGDRTN